MVDTRRRECIWTTLLKTVSGKAKNDGGRRKVDKVGKEKKNQTKI